MQVEMVFTWYFCPVPLLLQWDLTYAALSFSCPFLSFLWKSSSDTQPFIASYLGYQWLSVFHLWVSGVKQNLSAFVLHWQRLEPVIVLLSPESIAFCFLNKITTVTKKQKMTCRGFLYWRGLISLIADFRILTFDLKLYVINLIVQKIIWVSPPK